MFVVTEFQMPSSIFLHSHACCTLRCWVMAETTAKYVLNALL